MSTLRLKWLANTSLIVGLLSTFFSIDASAGCSPYVGQATLNEYYHNNQSPDKAKEYFIETKLLDRGIPASTYKNWSILICSQYGPDKNSALSRCITGNSNIAAVYTDTTLESNLTLASASGGQSWKVLDQSDFPAGYVDNNGGTGHGMEVFLLDQNGLIVDYTQVDGYSVHAGDLGATSCNYLYDNDYPGNNTFTMQRLPDGTGCWPQDPTSTSDTTANGTSISCLAAAPPTGSSGTPTQQATNTDSPSSGTYPYLVISDVDVTPGSTATFTVSIAGVLTVTVSKGIYSYSYDSSVHTFSSDIIFNYASQGGTATATGGDYNAVTLTSATLAAGLSSTTVSVSTNTTASIGEYFHAIISESASDTSGALITDNNGTATFTAPAIDHLAVSTATTSASTCSALAVTIQAQDAGNNPVTNYAGTITLGTSSNHGNWSATPTSGSNPDAPVNALNPSPDTDDNGAVQYTFDGGAGGDGGSITLYLLNGHADSNVTIAASDTANAVSASATGISFLDNVFLITPTTATAGVANSSTMIAGRPHTFSVALWTKDPTTGLCAIATGYNSATQGTKIYIDRAGELLSATDPTLTDATTSSKTISETIPAADNVTLDFSSGGSASFTLNTTDVGKYTLHISDDGNSFVAGKTVTGSIDLTAIPFAFTLDYSGQRAADLADNGNLDDSTGSDTSYALNAAGTAFLSVGSNFTLNIGAVLWDSADDADNNGVADTGANPYNNTLAPSFGSELSAAAGNFTSTLVLPTATTGGQSGILSAAPTPLSSTAFSGGSASATLNWSEVGIIDIGLSLSGYLGSIIPITGTMPYVGRFTPASYAVITSDGAYANTHTAGASAFTYVGESFGYQTDPAIQVYPLNIRQSMWVTGQSYAAGDYILSSDGNGRIYKVTSGGSSGGTEPNWPTTTGATVTVNGVSYEDVGPITAYVTLNSSANGGQFNKLSGSALTTTLAATDTVSTLATSGNEGTLSAPAYNLDGSLAFTLSGAAISLAHTTTPIAPFIPNIGIELASFSDADGISFADGLTLHPSGNNQRYGRAVLSDTYGSSASGNTLALPLTLQYFNGTDFVDNSDDANSLFNSSLLGCASTGTLACSDIAVLSADVANGEAYTLTANGTQGTLLYTLDLAGAAPALQYDWSNSGTLGNPSASATFGTYRGDDRFLFWREIP